MSVPCLCCGCSPWQRALRRSPVWWAQNIHIIFTPLYSRKHLLKCGYLRSLKITLWLPLREAFNISSREWCRSVGPKPTVGLKEVSGSEIFVRLPLRMNNLLHFGSIEHELKIRDKTRALAWLTPASTTLLLQTTVGPRGWEFSSSFAELLWVKIR